MNIVSYELRRVHHAVNNKAMDTIRAARKTNKALKHTGEDPRGEVREDLDGDPRPLL